MFHTMILYLNEMWKNTAVVIHELGYPYQNTIRILYKQFLEDFKTGFKIIAQEGKNVDIWNLDAGNYVHNVSNKNAKNDHLFWHGI